mmetsp:Transcript_29537/g.94921  ORF Transcript_29537/g.94921 Transcript_29537/m.94921 type:complete len:234 (+) Transcript_29537:539-1240(+)
MLCLCCSSSRLSRCACSALCRLSVSDLSGLLGILLASESSVLCCLLLALTVSVCERRISSRPLPRSFGCRRRSACCRFLSAFSAACSHLAICSSSMAQSRAWYSRCDAARSSHCAAAAASRASVRSCWCRQSDSESRVTSATSSPSCRACSACRRLRCITRTARVARASCAAACCCATAALCSRSCKTWSACARFFSLASRLGHARNSAFSAALASACIFLLVAASSAWLVLW